MMRLNDELEMKLNMELNKSTDLRSKAGDTIQDINSLMDNYQSWKRKTESRSRDDACASFRDDILKHLEVDDMQVDDKRSQDFSSFSGSNHNYNNSSSNMNNMNNMNTMNMNNSSNINISSNNNNNNNNNSSSSSSSNRNTNTALSEFFTRGKHPNFSSSSSSSTLSVAHSDILMNQSTVLEKLRLYKEDIERQEEEEANEQLELDKDPKSFFSRLVSRTFSGGPSDQGSNAD